MEKCYQLSSPAEIKVQTSKNYVACKVKYNLSNINQMGQNATWKYQGNVLGFSFDANNFFLEKKPIVKAAQWQSLIVWLCIFWSISNKYIYEIYKDSHNI